MERARLNRLGLLALCGGALGIGFAPIFVRLSEVGPSATAFYRLLIALPVLWCWKLREPPPLEPYRRPASVRDFLGLSLAGLLFVGDLSIWHWSMQYTTVANSTLLTNVAPIFVTLGAWLFYGESITFIFLLGMILALIGSGLLVGLSADVSPDHVWGNILAMVAAFFYAGYMLAVKQLRRTFTSLSIMAWSGLAACLGFFLVAWIPGERLWPETLSAWLVLAGLSLVSHLMGQTLIAFALGHLPASYSSVALLLQPVMAGVMAWIWFQERLSSWQIMGAVLVLVGIAISSRPGKSRTAR